MMTKNINPHEWVYVLVQNPGQDDQIVGQTESENNISFIPMFMDRESAIQGSIHIPKEKGRSYEIQAIIFEDLEKYAAQSQFILFVLDGTGKIIDKRAPFQVNEAMSSKD